MWSLPHVEVLACGRRAQRLLLALTAVMALITVEYTLGIGGAALRHVTEVALYNGVVLAAGAACVLRAVCDPRDRVAWAAMGAAVLAWGIGNTVWTFTVAD